MTTVTNKSTYRSPSTTHHFNILETNRYNPLQTQELRQQDII